MAEEMPKDFKSVTSRGNIYFVKSAPVFSALPLAGLKIGIDPGHQRYGNSDKETIAPNSRETKAKVSSGTRGVSTGVYEYVVNLEVSNLLKAALEEMGAEVLMTRYTHDIDISNQERAIMMNEWEADLVLRIHCNGSTNSKDNGTGMYVRKTGEKAEESAELAKALLDAVCSVSGARRSGLFKRDTYTGLNWSEVPCVLVEMGYMSNHNEDEKLNDPAYQALIVEGLVSGIFEYVSSINSGL